MLKRIFAFMFLALLSLQGYAATPAPVPCDYTKGACWKPPMNLRWQYQLQNEVNVNISATPYGGGAVVKPDVFDFDLYAPNGNLNTAAVAAIKVSGRKSICYLSGGTWENWRPDAGAFPESVKGRRNGWPGEVWLDIRQIEVLRPIMQARLNKCASAGFDAVEWDNVDGYSNRSGFPLTASQQIAYNATLANMTHQSGMAVGLKNTVELLAELAPYFDFAINEQCQQYSECGDYTSTFIQQAKPVFQVEYQGTLAAMCKPGNAANRNVIKKTLDLYATPWQVCR